MPGFPEKEQEYTTYEEGNYECKFKEWFPTDDDGDPSLILQSRFGENIPIIRYRTVYLGADGEEDGPVGSIDPMTELPLFVEAFGGDPTKLPKITMDNVVAALKQAVVLMDGSTEVYVNEKGWIQGVEGMSVPEGPQLFDWGRFTSKNDDGILSHIEGNFGPVVYGRLKIATGRYEGTEVPFALGYGLEVDADRLCPCLVTLVDRRSGKRRLRADSKRVKLMVETYHGPMNTFPVGDVEDIYNIVPEMAALFDEGGRTGQGYVNDRGFVDLNKLMPLAEGVEVKRTAAPLPPGEAAAPEPVKESPPAAADLTAAQAVLRQVISAEVAKHYEGEPAAWEDASAWKLTEAGKDWAKTDLSDVVDGLGLSKKFADYDVEAIRSILKVLGYDALGNLLGGEEDF